MGIKSEELILIIEDDQPTVGRVVEGLRTAGISNPILSLETGDDALGYLFRRDAYADSVQTRFPRMILLDLNLPGTDGREVLSDIKQDEALRDIPVTVLSSSSDERDIQACYAHGANSYIQKSADPAGYVNTMRRTKDFWFEVVALPRPQSA